MSPSSSCECDTSDSLSSIFSKIASIIDPSDFDIDGPVMRQTLSTVARALNGTLTVERCNDERERVYVCQCGVEFETRCQLQHHDCPIVLQKAIEIAPVINNDPTNTPPIQSLDNNGPIIDDDRSCRVCMEYVPNVVIVPCGHLILCNGCATKCKEKDGV